jgi:hypothetical protein
VPLAKEHLTELASNKLDLTRRQFVLGGLSVFTLSSISLYALTKEKKRPKNLLLSSATDRYGQHYLAALTITGEIYFKILIFERAHDSLYNPLTQQAVYFGRSPSRTIYVVDMIGKRLSTVVNAMPDRHFYGHGIMDKACRYLFAVENNIKSNRGCIGVYDVLENYKRVGELSTYGVGPHQALFLSDDATLVVANGGLISGSSQLKKKISQRSFESSLAYIDSHTGELLDFCQTQYSQLSLRHLTRGNDDRIFVGAQSYRNTETPLIFSHANGENLMPLYADDNIWKSHNCYTASLALGGSVLSVSSPRGNIVSFWNIETQAYVSMLHRSDIAGICTSSSSNRPTLFATTGSGLLVAIDSKNKHVLHNTITGRIAWDNHLSLATF